MTKDIPLLKKALKKNQLLLFLWVRCYHTCHIILHSIEPGQPEKNVVCHFCQTLTAILNPCWKGHLVDLFLVYWPLLIKADRNVALYD